MSCYRVKPRAVPLEQLGRDTIGGRPYLPQALAWPACRCGERMIFFFQLDVPADVAPFGGAHLLVFQCAVHGAATARPATARLPARFWEDAPWRVIVHRGPTRAHEPERRLRAAALALTRFVDPAPDGRGLPVFKVGGTPSWADQPEAYRCGCGADLVYVAQVPEQYPFQADDGDERTLFAAQDAYLCACAVGCDPRSVWPINQS